MKKDKIMIKRKSSILTVTDTSVTDTQLSVLIGMRVDEDILDFTGHFPNFPLLPGVTQIDWAMHYAQHYLNMNAEFKGMEVLKFQEPILPNMVIELELKWDIEKSKLYFTYRSHQGDAVSSHASGRIVLGA